MDVVSDDEIMDAAPEDEQTLDEQQQDEHEQSQQVADLETVSQVVEDSVRRGFEGSDDEQLSMLGDLAVKVDGLASARGDEGAGQSGSYVVVLDAEQWSDVQRCWQWAKGGLSACLFLALVCTLLVAALLGNRLWAAFSQGWRR